MVGCWQESPYGEFADVMLAQADGTRRLLAPTEEIAEFVAGTYAFDVVEVVPVRSGGCRAGGLAWRPASSRCPTTWAGVRRWAARCGWCPTAWRTVAGLVPRDRPGRAGGAARGPDPRLGRRRPDRDLRRDRPPRHRRGARAPGADATWVPWDRCCPSPASASGRRPPAPSVTTLVTPSASPSLSRVSRDPAQPCSMVPADRADRRRPDAGDVAAGGHARRRDVERDRRHRAARDVRVAPPRRLRDHALRRERADAAGVRAGWRATSSRPAPATSCACRRVPSIASRTRPTSPRAP